MRNENKIVSIIIPVYNGAAFVEETIESCLAQTYAVTEVILIDDGSSDESIRICEKYREKSNVTFLHNDENLGITKTINKGVRSSRGDYILLLGHDDKLGPSHVEYMVREFVPTVGIVCCDAKVIDKNGNVIGEVKSYVGKSQTINRMRLSRMNIVQSCGMMIRRNLFIEVGGFDERYRNYGEWLFYTMAIGITKLRKANGGEAYYRRHDTNISNAFLDNNLNPLLMEYYDTCRSNALTRLGPMWHILLRFYSCLSDFLNIGNTGRGK